VVVDIKYDSNDYLAIEEEPAMEWQEVLGEVSGHLHLFLGMSLLSFVEIAELLVFIVIRKLNPFQIENAPKRSINVESTVCSQPGTSALFDIHAIEKTAHSNRITWQNSEFNESKLTPHKKETSVCILPGTSASNDAD
jgi:hypothetical protein